ncbi:DUF11 domain-containing protein [Rubripirellula obstinata]|uniref:DUF11 domain-containing protein n=1 Tax=Rubripirellula obstinata TaxID=406547 RepID=UPI00122C2666|nr:DUF11 domain-containing protein [Rubripirellula obstinata]
MNRRFLVASTLIAIPAALLMASLSIGTNPEVPFSSSHEPAFGSGVRTALGQSSGTDESAIRQVIGKQPTTGPRRALFSTSNASTSRSSNTRSTSSSRSSAEPQGLFETLFGSRGDQSNDRRSTTRSSTNRSSTTQPRAASATTPNVDWDGIPFHDVNGNTVGRSGSTPLAKPIRSTTQTRVIRGGSNSRKLTASPTVAKKPTAAMSVPKPPAEARAKPKLRTFSSSESSRRSKPVAVASPRSTKSSVASIYGNTTKTEANYQSDDVADLVPRVRRRVIKPAPQAIAKQEPAKKEPKVAPESKIAKQVAPKAAGKVDAVKKAPAKVAEKPAEKNAAEKIAAKVEPKKVPELAAVKKLAAAPKAELQMPTASVAKADVSPKPAYSTPVDPETTAIPPAPAYAASGGTDSFALTQPNPAESNPAATAKLPQTSTHAASVSHRTGPPAAAFVPIRQPAGSSVPASAGYPTFEDRTPSADRFGANSTNRNGYQSDGFNAVGSGVAQDKPVYETALARDRNYADRGNYDPYGSRGNYQTPRMSTYGQPSRNQPSQVAVNPVPAPAERELAPTRPSHETAAYPMHPIPGHQADSGFEKRVVKRSSSNPPKTDQFADASGNRMRTKSAAVAKLPAAGAHIVTSELPGIRVITNGPSEVMIRQNNEYEIRVENRGSIDAKGLLVRALIPDWADVQGKNATVGDIDSQGDKGSERLVWIIDHLPAGTSEQMFVRLMAARSGTYNLDVDWTLQPQRSVAQVKVHEPRLELAIEGPGQVVYGHSQTYKVRVLNPGDGVAANVVFTLSPNSATPQTQRIGDIPAGKEAQFEVELTAQDLGDLKIQGLAMGDLELRAEGNKTISVLAAQLEAILGGPELKYQNTEAVYSLQLQNLGTATSEHVIASLRIPPGVKYLGGIDGAVQSRDMLKWEVTDLAPGASRDYQFRCNMIATGDHQFAFDCKGTAAGQASVAIETSVESIADLVLTINDPPAPAPIDSEVEYEIIVRNRGSREAKDVRAIAQFSHGIEPQRVEGQSGEVVTGQVLFDPIPRIGAGEEMRLRVIALATKAGHHRFRTEVRSGDTVLVAEEATHYMSPRSDRVSRRSSDAPLTR